MNELMITNIDNMSIRSYAIYYTNNERFYVIYTEKEKDENGYVVLHVAKVLKEVNSTPEGIVPTGRFIGLEISDAAEWDAVKMDISSIVANKQSGTETNVKYLPVDEIVGINIKSSKIFKLREDVVSSIIVETPVMSEPVQETPVVDEPVVQPLEGFVPVQPAVSEEPVVETPVSEPLTNMAPTELPTDLPAIAPNPFEFQPVETPVIEETVEEEPVVPNPYEEIQKAREEEMVSQLANDNMQDIVPTPFIPVDELEANAVDAVVPVTLDEVSLETPVIDEPMVLNEVEQVTPIADEPVVQPVIDQVQVPVTLEEPIAPVEEEVVSSESFVDSIVADVSDIVDDKPVEVKPSINHEIDSRYEKLYKEELEKTIELEKELKELQSKLNNIKNIIE